MSVMRNLVFLLLPLFAACATPEQHAEALSAYIEANYAPVCTKLGYQPNSDGHRNCMVSMYNTDQTRFNNTAWGRLRR